MNEQTLHMLHKSVELYYYSDLFHLIYNKTVLSTRVCILYIHCVSTMRVQILVNLYNKKEDIFNNKITSCSEEMLRV